MNFQDIIREVYDGTNKALKTTGSFSASLGGNVTLNPSSNFIGIVTVANPGATSGNVTLDPGSKTGIVGNITLSDPKGFIGLVTIVGSLSAASGNVTLDPGSKTGIVGNITGLVRLGGSGFTNLVDAGAAADDTSNAAIGLYGHSLNHVFNGTTWDRIKTANIANATTGLGLLGTGALGFDGTNYRRIITGTDGRLQANVTVNNPVSIAGNITLSDPKGFIGLVTIVGSLSAASGNVTLDDGSLTGLVAGVNSIGFATVHLGTPTIYAVVNTGAAGVQNSMVTVNAGPNQIGSVTVSHPITIGNAMVTVTLGTSLDSTNDSVAIGTALPAGANYIGLVTATQDSTIFPPRGIMTTNLATPSISQMAVFLYGRNAVDGNWEFVTTADHNADYASGPLAAGVMAEYDDASTSTVTENKFASLRMGSDRILYTHPMGNLTLSDSKGFIGLVTVVGSLSPAAGNVTLDAGSRTGILGNITLSDSKTYVGLVTATVGNTLTVNAHALSAGAAYIGLVTAVPSTTSRSIVGNLTISISGTSKTLIPMPFALAGTSVVTVAVPSATFKVTQFIASANATVGVSIKSGATYLVGNASIRVNLAPRGGWVESGSTDSPVYVGLAAAAAIVVEKDDATTAVAGKVIYFDE